jgi:hypothetical protein
MPISVDAYTVGGVASGVPSRPGHLREMLEQDGQLMLQHVQWRPLDGKTQPAGDVTIASDDILIATTDEDTSIPVHAQWHAIRLELGPYVVEGEMPTMPGFDPGRALTRPTGEFVLLRDVRLGRRSADEAAQADQPIGHHALINRYVVETVSADLMLGFFFPGAVMISSEEDPSTPVNPTTPARPPTPVSPQTPAVGEATG